MRKTRLILMVLISLYISNFLHPISTINSIDPNTTVDQLMRKHLLVCDQSAYPLENWLETTVSTPKFSTQQLNKSILLNLTGTKDPSSVEYEPNIWQEVLGSDPLILSNPSVFENGFIVTHSTVDEVELEGVNNSLFTRIGNSGYSSETNQTLNDEILSGISAGWKIGFSVREDFDLINVSFKWRFDAPDAAFDDFTEVIPGVVFDDSPDYQEVRARINDPLDSSKSFWMENPPTEHNPNGTVFYRMGPQVISDEEWFTSSYVFHVSKVDSADYSLELGVFLNTREWWNEYIDVWFDDILIIGMKGVPDNNPPQLTSSGLSRTESISQFLFWANFSDGKWESPIKNVTVHYDQTSDLGTNTSSIPLELEAHKIDVAGLNQSHWLETVNFNFDDYVEFYFLAFDHANNSYTTTLQVTTIGDFVPPVVESPLDVSSPDFIIKEGNGTIIIRVNASDWGYGIEDVFINYSINGAKKGTSMTNITSVNGITHYETKLNASYGSLIEFNITLIDREGNSEKYPGHNNPPFSIQSDVDKVPPTILNFDIFPSTNIEERTFVTVNAVDTFGQIDDVFLVVRSENGSFFNQSRNNERFYLENTSTEGLYELRVMERERALKLPFDPNYENYSITLYVRDMEGMESNLTKYYVVPDRVEPKVNVIELEYPYPTYLEVWVSATDLGSGIESVMLEKKTTGGWSSGIEMVYNEETIRYTTVLQTDWFGNELIEFRVTIIDKEGNSRIVEHDYTTQIFVTTDIGLIVSEALVVTIFVVFFTLIKMLQLRRLRVVRRRRFDIALGRSERLAYLGEEAMFGFIAAYGQSEGVTSTLVWEPRMIGNFYQYLKELADKANNTVSFILQAQPEDLVSFVDFSIEEIACSAITFAYPISTLPQQWLSSITLDQVPMGGSQGVLLLMLLMREKWGDTANNFQEEIAEGIVELKDLILSGEPKEVILQKAREFRLFISGTVEVLDEIEIEADEVSDDVMGDFESGFLDDDDE